MSENLPDTITIACLPVAGIENPYQHLMIDGLNQNKKLKAFNGVNDRFFGILRTGLKYKPDFIHFDWIESYYTRRYSWLTYLDIPFFLLQVWFVRYILRIKLVWTLHNLYPHVNYQRKLHIWVQRHFAKHINIIRLFSEKTLPDAKNILKVSAHKFLVCPEGSYIGYYPNTVSKTESRKYLNIDPFKKVFLFFGSFSPYKGILELMQSFKLNNAILICAGKKMDENYFKKIKAALKDHIQLQSGFISVDKVQYYFNAADCVVLPFQEIENSGSVILAMGFKKPVIAPVSNVLSERLEYQPQLLFQKGDLEQKLQYTNALSDADLEIFGDSNFKQILKLNWTDFGEVFMNFKMN